MAMVVSWNVLEVFLNADDCSPGRSEYKEEWSQPRSRLPQWLAHLYQGLMLAFVCLDAVVCQHLYELLWVVKNKRYVFIPFRTIFDNQLSSLILFIPLVLFNLRIAL